MMKKMMIRSVHLLRFVRRSKRHFFCFYFMFFFAFIFFIYLFIFIFMFSFRNLYPMAPKESIQHKRQKEKKNAKGRNKRPKTS